MPMPIPPGRYMLGPNDATLTVRTGKAGAASKAGHNLRIEVTSWSSTLDVPDAPEKAEMALTADPRSLRVREGTGGMQALGDDDMASIEQTIDDEVLEGAAIQFRSRTVRPGPGGALSVEGDLELAGSRHPVAFDITAGEDGRLTGSARIRQTEWGIKPYSALFGTLKVVDEVDVEIDGKLPAPVPAEPGDARRDHRG
jgi:polyisoprenoid-binding protein YceI